MMAAASLGTVSRRCRSALSVGAVACHCRSVDVAGWDSYRSQLTLARIGAPRLMSPQHRRMRNAVPAHPGIPWMGRSLVRPRRGARVEVCPREGAELSRENGIRARGSVFAPVSDTRARRFGCAWHSSPRSLRGCHSRPRNLRGLRFVFTDQESQKTRRETHSSRSACCARLLIREPWLFS